MNLSWADFKAFLTQRGASVQWLIVNGMYMLWAFDGPMSVLCSIPISETPSTEQTDFETNYKASGNTRLAVQADSDNAPLARVKAAPTGWTFQFRFFEFTTAKLASLVNNDALTGAALSDASMKLYKADNSEVTDSSGEAEVVRTVIDIEPTYDFYAIGGHCKCIVTPATDCRLNVVAVPDIPAAYGGSKIMVQGANFKLISGNDKVDMDGRAAKLLSYSATYHTNKLRVIIRHTAGEQNTFILGIQHYKA